MDDNRFVVNYDESGHLIGGGGYLLDFPISSIKNPFKAGGAKKMPDLDDTDDNNETNDINNNQYMIPAGLYYKDIIIQSYPFGTFDYKNHDTIDDSLYDSLYELASFDQNVAESSNIKPKKYTRKNKNNANANANANTHGKNKKGTKKRK